MLSEIITKELILTSIWNGLEPIMPILILLVVVPTILISILKKIYYTGFRFYGYSHRQAKKKAEFVSNLTDLANTLKDVYKK